MGGFYIVRENGLESNTNAREGKNHKIKNWQRSQLKQFTENGGRKCQRKINF